MSDENARYKLSDFDYHLPQGKIAQYPPEKRGGSKLLVLDRESGTLIDEKFAALPDYIDDGSLLIMNDTKVLPARLFGNKTTGGKVELLLLERMGGLEEWKALVNPSKRVKVGADIFFGTDNFKATVFERIDERCRRVVFSGNDIHGRLYELGEMPIPPYIRRASEELDKERYQTIYARDEGAVAAPTAGLHFTHEIMAELEARNISIKYLTLHVGLGTFEKIEAENITEHKMHKEYAILSAATARAINAAKEMGRKVVAVGTTSVRVLETAGRAGCPIQPFSGWTDLYIYPPYNFKVVDALVTNFHLPESSLVILVATLAGRENILQAYKHAVEHDYRFFSYGDAMFII